MTNHSNTTSWLIDLLLWTQVSAKPKSKAAVFSKYRFVLNDPNEIVPISNLLLLGRGHYCLRR